MKIAVCTKLRHPPHQCCGHVGGLEIVRKLELEVIARGIDTSIEQADCLNMCRNGPCVRVLPDGKDWLRVNESDISNILDYLSLRTNF